MTTAILAQWLVAHWLSSWLELEGYYWLSGGRAVESPRRQASGRACEVVPRLTEEGGPTLHGDINILCAGVLD